MNIELPESSKFLAGDYMRENPMYSAKEVRELLVVSNDRIRELEFEAGYRKPVSPGDNTYPNAPAVAACLRNSTDDLLTEARFVLWQARQLTAERAISDKLEKALQRVAGWVPISWGPGWDNAKAVLAEVAAMREAQK